MRALPLLALAALACASSPPRPGEPGYPYNPTGTYEATFLVGGDRYTGTLETAVVPGGALSGSFLVSGEVTASGVFTGTLAGDSLSWAGDYALAEIDCPGTLSATGTVVEGGDALSGDLQVVGCDTTYSGTWSAERP